MIDGKWVEDLLKIQNLGPTQCSILKCCYRKDMHKNFKNVLKDLFLIIISKMYSTFREKHICHTYHMRQCLNSKSITLYLHLHIQKRSLENVAIRMI